MSVVSALRPDRLWVPTLHMPWPSTSLAGLHRGLGPCLPTISGPRIDGGIPGRQQWLAIIISIIYLYYTGTYRAFDKEHGWTSDGVFCFLLDGFSFPRSFQRCIGTESLISLWFPFLFVHQGGGWMDSGVSPVALQEGVPGTGHNIFFAWTRMGHYIRPDWNQTFFLHWYLETYRSFSLCSRSCVCVCWVSSLSHVLITRFGWARTNG